MACDSYARILAMAAIEAAESGGGSTRGISSVYISEGHLHIVFTDSTDTDVGTVVGNDGKVYIPHISETKVLTWTIEDAAGEIPDPVDLNSSGEWQPVKDEETSTYVWEDM